MYPNNNFFNMNNYSNNYGQRQQVIRVNGRNGAEAYQIAPNSSALLLDTSAPLVWLIQTDGAGYKTATPYSITPYEPAPAVDNNQLAQLISSIDERVRKLEEDRKGKDESNTSNVSKLTVTKVTK